MALDVTSRERKLIERIDESCRALRECLMERGLNLEAEFRSDRVQIQKDETRKFKDRRHLTTTQKRHTFLPANLNAEKRGRSVQMTWFKVHVKPSGKTYRTRIPKGRDTRYNVSLLTNDAPRQMHDLIRGTESRAAVIRGAQTEIKALEISLHSVRRYFKAMQRKAVGQNRLSLDEVEQVQNSDGPQDTGSHARIAPEPRSREDWKP